MIPDALATLIQRLDLRALWRFADGQTSGPPLAGCRWTRLDAHTW
jgi:hypothetical protein